MQVIFNKFFKYCFPFLRWADSALCKINNTIMLIHLDGTIEFVHIEQVSTLDKFTILCFGVIPHIVDLLL
jgi:hypothetical protein